MSAPPHTRAALGVVLVSVAAALTGCTHAPSAPPPASAPPAAVLTANGSHPDAAASKAERDEEKLEVAIGLIVEGILDVSYGDYADEALSRYVNEIGTRLAKRSERPELAWHFQVLDSPDAGAHALPGGRVTITRGLLAFLGSEAELAAVLAHEIAHVAFRHSHSKWSPTATVAEVGDAAAARERSRDADQERQADTVGARYLADAGYDPHAMVAALSALERAAAHQTRQALEASSKKSRKETGEKGEDDFDPHPAPPARIARAAVAAGTGRGEWERAGYLSRIAGLEWGAGSSTPLLSGSRYVIPGELTFAVPRGYRAKCDAGVFQAGASAGDTSVTAFRVRRSFVSQALKSSVTKGRHATREIAGRAAVVARSPAVKSPDTKKDDSLWAVVDADEGVLVVMTKGTSAASEKLLDSFLAGAERDGSPHRPRNVLAIERADGRMRFDDFVSARCSETPLTLASALNARAPGDELAPTAQVKCLKMR